MSSILTEFLKDKNRLILMVSLPLFTAQCFTMKYILLFLLINSTGIFSSYCQLNAPDGDQRKALVALIDQYSKAREKNDTVLLKEILTNDVDQLASSGEWRM